MQSLWMIFAAVCFAFASLSVKFATPYASAAQALTVRGVVALVCISLWCWWVQQDLRTAHPKLHASRSVSGVASLALFTYAVMALPLATGVTLNYTSPVWLALLVVSVAVVKGRKLPSAAMLVCIAASMAGVVLLLKPIFAAGQTFDAAVGLASGVLSAVAYWQIKSLGATGEPVTRIVFYHSLTTVLIGALWWGFGAAVQGAATTNDTAAAAPAIPTAASLLVFDLRALPWLLCNGALAMAGQIAMTRAYAAGKALFVSNLMYLTVVFSAFLGAWFTADRMDAHSYIGIVVIVSCSVAATVLNVRGNKV
jgi:S-adenosylmethionine uptake transporter